MLLLQFLKIRHVLVKEFTLRQLHHGETIVWKDRWKVVEKVLIILVQFNCNLSGLNQWWLELWRKFGLDRKTSLAN